jgi:membrane-bound serine protease (ClpP class)
MVQATLVAAIAAAVQFASPALLSAEESGRPALMIEIDGAIGPATARYVKEALTTAGELAGRRRYPASEHAGRPRN